MKQIKLLTAIILFSVSASFSQNLFYKSYNWGQPILNFTDTVNEKIILNDLLNIEFAFEGDNFYEFRLFHTTEYLGSNEQIERNNKIHINLNSGSELVLAKARVITPSNKIIEIGQDKVLKSTNETTGVDYHYFALDGLEKGSIIEYLYVIKKSPSYNGIYWYFQDEYPTNEFTFNLIAPKHLGFSFEIYNDTNTIHIDSTETEKSKWDLHVENIEALEFEDQAPYNQSLKQIWYKLDRNFAHNTRDISSYGSASQNIYQRIFVLEDKKTIKNLIKFLKPLTFDKATSKEQKIIAIENYIKTNINIIDNVGRELNDINWIIANKTASTNGVTILLAQAYKIFDINFEIVLTNDRTKTWFNKDFESFNCLSTYLIYFPEYKKYIAPENFIFRYPIIPHEFTDNYGLFIKETALGEFKTGIGKVKYIEPLPYNISYNNLNIKATISNELDSVLLDVDRISSGYYAVYEQGYYSLLNQEKRDEMVREGLKLLMENFVIKNYEVVNGDINLVGKEPYTIKCKGTNSELIENAGNKYLFKVGNLIGPQVEMYSEKERKLPVWDTYKRSFGRNIEISIPDEYVVKNIDDLIFTTTYKKEGKTILLFESNYVINNNKITITMNEYYDQLKFNLAEIEKYKSVVNAAADFNKVVLILEKK